MNPIDCIVKTNRKLTETTFILECFSEQIAREIKAGQFCNIRVNDSYIPLLRRPFSVSDCSENIITFMINLQGNGTKILSEKMEGDRLDVLGPLGHGFNYLEDYDVALIVGGGIGVAPFPFLTKQLNGKKEIQSFLGFRNKNEIITEGLINYKIATDDGSFGTKGNVIDLLEKEKLEFINKKVKMFACGPNPMLRAVKSFCIENNINCEISAESGMACGIGICQGCPIDSVDEEKYLLICKDGPVFNINDVKL